MPIRSATHDDAAAIAAIYNDAIANTAAIMWHAPKPVEMWRERLIDRPTNRPALVALDDSGAVVGFTTLGPYDTLCGYDDVAEWSLYVAEAARGQGVGRSLGEAVMEAGRATSGGRSGGGLHSVISRVTAGNIASEKLHDRLGFRKVGVFEQLGRKFNQRHDVIVYQLIL